MSTSSLGNDLNYLSDAAHLLAEAAPETSAFMMSCRSGLMSAHDLRQSDVQKQHVCGACGHIMIPGHGSTLKIESDRALRNKKRRKSGGDKTKPQPAKDQVTRSGPCKVFSCGHCQRETKISLPPPAPILRKKTYDRSTTRPSALRGTEAQRPTANASSKKRAKSRKAGLQALIDQNQVNRNSAKSGLGLSLADFMKK